MVGATTLGATTLGDRAAPAPYRTHLDPRMTTPAAIERALEDLLPRVQKPARYTGGEFNSVVKDWRTPGPHGRPRVALCLIYPDIYDIGMSNLGIQILYEVVNRDDRFVAERAFAPWVDMEAELRAAGVPLYGLETRHPLGDFDVVGFSLAYELDYTNVLNCLNLAGIPLLSAARRAEDPIVIAGGSNTTNPEPLADFVDLFLIGEGEEAITELLSCYDRLRPPHGGRPDRGAFLRAACEIDGVYVPSFYQATYGTDGTLTGLEPAPGAPAAATLPIKKRVADLVDFPLPSRPVVPFMETVHDRAAIEIMRGCGRGCRFCQADMIYRPRRVRPREQIVQMADALLRATGYNELSLLSLSSADIKHIDLVLQDAITLFDDDTLTVSLPSTRVDAFNVDLAALIERGKRSGLTFAPEAGTERMREVIHKGVSEEETLRAAELAYGRGWQTIKLYFMIGLPTETDEDVAGIAALARKVVEVGRRHHGNRARVTVGVSTMVPKPHTPFQWAAQATRAEILSKVKILQEGMRDRGLRFSWHDPESTHVEGILARGDRRVGRAILEAWRRGARFDAWSAHLRWDAWTAGMTAAGLDVGFYTWREKSVHERLPWDHVDVGVPRWHLVAQWRRAQGLEAEPRAREKFVLLHQEDLASLRA